MNRWILSHRWAVVAVCAVLGAALGAVLAMVAVPAQTRFQASADVAILPAPELSIADASSFWEVLTRGQVNRTAAIVYGQEDHWLPPAAAAAGVSPSELKLTAAAVPDSTVVSVVVEAPTAAAAVTALQTVLAQAAPQVAAVTTPFVAKPLAVQDISAKPVHGPTASQLTVAGGLAGGLIGLALGLLIVRLTGRAAGEGPTDSAEPTEGT